MKSFFKILLLILLTSCGSITSSNLNTSSFSTSSSFNSGSTTASKVSSSSNKVSSSTLSRPSGTNPDGGGLRMPIPENKNNKIILGKSNEDISTFAFENFTLPEHFRAIYGNNFHKGDFYADGTLKMASSTDAKKGFQTGMFEGDLKLEIRLNIGQMNNASGGDKIQKDKPVLSIYGFDDEGNFIRASYVDNFDKSSENKSIRLYMDGTDISYLEVRAMQSPYKSSQAYNFAFRGIDLIAWPYPL